MDSDFNAPSGDPVNSEETGKTKATAMDESSSANEGSVSNMNDSVGADSSEHPEPTMSDNFGESESAKSEEPMGSVTPPAVVAPVKIHSAHKLIFGYIGLVVMVALIVGVYVWQHGKVTSLATKLAASNSELSSQQQTVSTLKAELSKAESELASSTPTLGISVVKSTRYTPSGTNTTKNSGVAVDVTIKNSTSKAVSLETSDFKLKDTSDDNYVATNYPSQTTDSSLPTGYTLLIDQSLAPGASATGTLEFGVPTTTLTSFTLVYNSQSIPVTVTSN